ncbi:MAG: squalene/phytoene synthase family protein [Planctomycetota bacterium]|nr:squalene/phytoene synthase family protein [Planctomycetota bacterium]
MQARRDWCRAMLPKVSRTFAACIELLPEPTRRRVLVAYLLCRIADTIEDCPRLPPDEKRRWLAAWSAALADDGCDPRLETLFAEPASDDERLAQRARLVLAEFRSFAPAARAAIRPWVQEMSEGMAAFAARQGDAGAFCALEDERELDRYCWFVAGTVGHLLTELFRLQSPRIDAARFAALKQRAADFGLGLQLTNIIKDVADDRRRGWCFVPRLACARHGLSPEALLDVEQARGARAVMEALIAKASAHLERALEYCLLLPPADYRLRLFCLTPLFFAVRTLAVASADPRLLDPAHKVKIARREVYGLIALCHAIAPSDAAIVAAYRRCSRRKLLQTAVCSSGYPL